MQHNRTDPSGYQPRLVSLNDRDLTDLHRLLGKLRGGHPEAVKPPLLRASDARSPEDANLERARRILERRGKRAAIFGRAMFGEPSWVMLLILYLSSGGQRLTQASLGDLAGASRSTAARWAEYLEDQRLIERQSHPTDKRQIFVTLSDKGRKLLNLYLSDTGPGAG